MVYFSQGSNKLTLCSQYAFLSGFFEKKPYLFFDKKYRIVKTAASGNSTTPTNVQDAVFELSNSEPKGPLKKEEVIKIIEMLPNSIEHFSSPAFLREKTLQELASEAKHTDMSLHLLNQLLTTNFKEALPISLSVFSEMVEQLRENFSFPLNSSDLLTAQESLAPKVNLVKQELKNFKQSFNNLVVGTLKAEAQAGDGGTASPTAILAGGNVIYSNQLGEKREKSEKSEKREKSEAQEEAQEQLTPPIRRGFDSRIERPQALPIPQADIVVLFQKMNYGEPLSETEQLKLDSLDLSDFVYLSSGEYFKPDVFRFDKNNIIRVIFSFKNSEIFVMESDFINKNKKKTNNSQTLDALKNQESKLELFFVIVQNKLQVTSTELLDVFYQKFFENGIREFLPKSVLLETIQFQLVFPTKNKGNLTQLSIPSTGLYSSDSGLRGGASIKPFVLSLVPLGVTGARNAFKILFPFFTEDLRNADVFYNFRNKLEKLKENLIQPIVIGESGELVLKLVVKTTRGFNNKPFVPIQNASWGGFSSNARVRNSKSILLSVDPESLITDSQNSARPSKPMDSRVIEAEVITPKDSKNTKKPKQNTGETPEKQNNEGGPAGSPLPKQQ